MSLPAPNPIPRASTRSGSISGGGDIKRKRHLSPTTPEIAEEIATLSDGRTFRRAALPAVDALLCRLGASPPAALAQPPNDDAANRAWQRGAIDHALKICARLNAGLSAFAIVLALLVATGICAARHPEMFQPEQDAAADAIGFTEQESGLRMGP
jgi:hypothetical protein